MARTDISASNAMLFDMHCHLDFIENAAEFETLATVCGITSLSNTIKPEDYVQLQDSFANTPYARLALGAHPWWIACGRIDEASLELFEKLATDAPYIGEIGLDFSGERGETKDVQLAALERILKAAGSNKLISLHGSNAESELLDVLESTGAAESCDCILHWYSGPADQLKRAIDLDCYFSIGKRMVKTKRGAEYARIIPVERLLLESDMPSREHAHYSPSQWNADLTDALLMIAEARGADPSELLEVMSETSKRLFDR